MATHQKKHIQNKGVRELIFRDPKKGQEYAVITRLFGDFRYECQLLNGEKVKARAPGRLTKGPKKTVFLKDTYILIEKDFSTTEKDKWEIVHKYSNEDWNSLARQGEHKIIKNNENNEVAIIMEGEADNNDAIEVIDEDYINNI